MKIQKVYARQIYDSRCMPTIECEIMLSSGEVARASIPCGVQKGLPEAHMLRDVQGDTIIESIRIINNQLGPLFVGMEPNVIQSDQMLIELDGTPHKTKLGGNTILALSTAICKAQAVAEGLELYECIGYLYDIQFVSIPLCMFTIFNGGRHTQSGEFLKEILFMPYGTTTFREAFEIAVTVFKHVGAFLKANGLPTDVGPEGGYAVQVTDVRYLLDLLCSVIDGLGFTSRVMIAIDMAASLWYDPTTALYTVEGKQVHGEELIEWYKLLAFTYPLYAIEDGLSQHDWQGWKLLTKALGQTIQLIGDDLFVTNGTRVVQAIEQDIANAIVIKPTQIGTITEALQIAKLAQANDFDVILSHRAGETEDDCIADLAIGCNASQFKSGGLLRGERLAKYHRLLRVEEYLTTELSAEHRMD